MLHEINQFHIKHIIIIIIYWKTNVHIIICTNSTVIKHAFIACIYSFTVTLSSPASCSFCSRGKGQFNNNYIIITSNYRSGYFIVAYLLAWHSRRELV